MPYAKPKLLKCRCKLLSGRCNREKSTICLCAEPMKERGSTKVPCSRYRPDHLTAGVKEHAWIGGIVANRRLIASSPSEYSGHTTDPLPIGTEVPRLDVTKPGLSSGYLPRRSG
jgi:hypothetical protein